MPQGREKSKRFRKISVRTPGGRVVTHLRERKPSQAVCAVTKKPLAGVPRGRPSEIRKVPRSARRPDRPYGGKLSSPAMRATLLENVPRAETVSGPLFGVGRLCVKLAGRDAGQQCVVVEIVDNNFVIVDGGVRRRKVNVRHLEPVGPLFTLKAKASHENVAKLFKEQNLPVWTRKSKKVVAKPVKQRGKKVVAEQIAPKKVAKKKEQPVTEKKEVTEQKN